MKILISKLPKSGWWQKGVPKYKDNPAMLRGSVPDLPMLNQERSKLIAIIKEAGHQIIEIDFPDQLDKQNPKHDFIFVRDSYISDQNGTAIILRAGEPARRVENVLMKTYLKNLGLKIIQMPNESGYRADGGEFYFCANEGILFSGLQRNTLKGAEYVAQNLNVNKMILLNGRSFHLDTFFTPCLDIYGNIAAIIICEQLLENESKISLHNFGNNNGIPIFDIPTEDAIGSGNKLGAFATNALPLPGLLIKPSFFTDRTIDQKLSELDIEVIVTPTSQFQLSGGSIHCITNEL